MIQLLIPRKTIRHIGAIEIIKQLNIFFFNYFVCILVINNH